MSCLIVWHSGQTRLITCHKDDITCALTEEKTIEAIATCTVRVYQVLVRRHHNGRIEPTSVSVSHGRTICPHQGIITTFVHAFVQEL